MKPPRMLNDPVAWPPDPAEELYQLLLRDFDDPFMVRFRPALEELSLWLDNDQMWNNDHVQVWRGVRVDFKEAVDALGNKLRLTVPQLSVLLSIPKTVDGKSLKDSPILDRFRIAMVEACENLRSPLSGAAAFDDLVDACRCITTSASAIRGLLRAFYDVLHLNGRPLDSMREKLRMILDDDIEPEDRMTACVSYLSTLGNPESHVVWIGYDGASLKKPICRENVTFHDGSTLAPFTELIDWKAPMSDRWVAVRVQLPPGHYADPIQRARNDAARIVTFARLQSEESDWRPFGGALHVGVSRQALGHSPQGRSGDALGGYLEDVALNETSEGWVDAINALEHSRTSPPSASVILDVRLIELIGRHARKGDWGQHMDSHLRGGWAMRKLRRELWRAPAEALRDQSLLILHQELGEIRKRIEGDGERAFLALKDIYDLLPAHHYWRRHLREVLDDSATPGALKAWLQRLALQHASLVRRLVRCRNALAHGSPVQSEVIAGIAQFAHQQAENNLHVVLSDPDPLVAHQKSAASYKARRKLFDSASTSVEALFGVVPD